MSLHSEMKKCEDSNVILLIGKQIAKEAGQTCDVSADSYAAGYIAGMLAMRNADSNKVDAQIAFDEGADITDGATDEEK